MAAQTTAEKLKATRASASRRVAALTAANKTKLSNLRKATTAKLSDSRVQTGIGAAGGAFLAGLQSPFTGKSADDELWMALGLGTAYLGHRKKNNLATGAGAGLAAPAIAKWGAKAGDWLSEMITAYTKGS